MSVPLGTQEIVCLGEGRPVINGRVRCPLRPGEPTAIGICLSCRLLAWLPNDRLLRLECTAGPPQAGRHPADSPGRRFS